jgi:hypothetical protein
MALMTIALQAQDSYWSFTGLYKIPQVVVISGWKSKTARLVKPSLKPD